MTMKPPSGLATSGAAAPSVEETMDDALDDILMEATEKPLENPLGAAEGPPAPAPAQTTPLPSSALPIIPPAKKELSGSFPLPGMAPPEASKSSNDDVTLIARLSVLDELVDESTKVEPVETALRAAAIKDAPAIMDALASDDALADALASDDALADALASDDALADALASDDALADALASDDAPALPLGEQANAQREKALGVSPLARMAAAEFEDPGDDEDELTVSATPGIISISEEEDDDESPTASQRPLSARTTPAPITGGPRLPLPSTTPGRTLRLPTPSGGLPPILPAPGLGSSLGLSATGSPPRAMTPALPIPAPLGFPAPSVATTSAIFKKVPVPIGGLVAFGLAVFGGGLIVGAKIWGGDAPPPTAIAAAPEPTPPSAAPVKPTPPSPAPTAAVPPTAAAAVPPATAAAVPPAAAAAVPPAAAAVAPTEATPVAEHSPEAVPLAAPPKPVRRVALAKPKPVRKPVADVPAAAGVKQTAQAAAGVKQTAQAAAGGKQTAQAAAGGKQAAAGSKQAAAGSKQTASASSAKADKRTGKGWVDPFAQ
jgi:hypothetical protein